MAEVKKITPKITMLKLGGLDSNVYVIDGKIAIDAGTGFKKEELQEALKKADIDAEKIKLLVATHCHFDHIGGALCFPKAKIAIHEKDAGILESKNPLASYALFFASTLKKIPKPSLKLADGETIRVGDVKLEVIHTAGHTSGSICLFEPKQGILFSGDTIFSKTAGRTDLISGSNEAMRDSLEKLSSLNIQAILPGHGSIIKEKCTEHIRSIIASL